MARDIEQFEGMRFVVPGYDGPEFITLPADPYAERPGVVRVLAVLTDGAPVVFQVAASAVTTREGFASVCFAWMAEQEERAAVASASWLRGGH